ncbi:MAG: TrkH family potassium uptake protein [Alphaproteobacteria bacterium]|nr:TrkH family potassium uptake protein [Alphaproteobacteria bacterium]
MLVPAWVDFALGNLEWRGFLVSAAITLFVGGSLLLTELGYRGTLSIEQGFILTFVSWIVLAVFAALPFVFADSGLSFADAVFEAMSGLTTTGSTVITGLDAMPEGILLWRAMLQLLGGIGIIVVAVAVLPMLRIGGMQLFRLESSEKSEKAVPRAAELALAVSLAYLILTLACFIAYKAGGMSTFDAAAHAMSTISTGGFSTHDSSFGHFSPALQYTSIAFMLAGGLPMLLFVQIARGKLRLALLDPQLRVFLAVVAVATVAMAAFTAGSGLAGSADAIRLSLFNVTSIVTTTGFAANDYGAWGAFVAGVVFLITFSGACAGSTSGGFKVYRLYIVSASLWLQMRRVVHPHGVFTARYAGRPISEDVVASVFIFFFFFILTFGVISIALTLMGLDMTTAISATATCLANVGPGLGTVVGPAGTFAPLPDAAIWLLTAAMLLGRLELFTVIVLLNPWFWRN